MRACIVCRASCMRACMRTALSRCPENRGTEYYRDRVRARTRALRSAAARVRASGGEKRGGERRGDSGGRTWPRRKRR